MERQHPETMWMTRKRNIPIDPEVQPGQVRCTRCGKIGDKKTDFFQFGCTGRHRQPCKVCAVIKGREYRESKKHGN